MKKKIMAINTMELKFIHFLGMDWWYSLFI